MLSAFRILNATRNNKMFWEVDACLTLFTARVLEPSASSRLIELSRPNAVEACDIGVVGGDDIAFLADAHVLNYSSSLEASG